MVINYKNKKDSTNNIARKRAGFKENRLFLPKIGRPARIL
jgi:hypothetical protein